MPARLRHSSGVKIAAKKTTDRCKHSETILRGQRAVDISINSERGETRHSRAWFGPPQIVRCGMEAFRECYTWFERCRLEARVGRERLVLGFAYAPTGKLFRASLPPFGLSLNQRLLFLASVAILYPRWPFFVAAWRAL